MSKFKENFTVDGSIVRITMKNFMTYKHESFWPGPNFNVTVGPNGSGKSSIVTALSVALGGDLSSLNRQTDLATLINSGSDKEQAKVEVELFVKEGNNMVVTCTLDANHPPQWKLQGKPVSKKELAGAMDKFQIQPGNLCQFLPQDVVRDFPNMKNQQIFYSTVKAIGDEDLLETYNGLKDLENAIKNIENDKESKEKTLKILERKEERFMEARNLMENRKTIEDKKVTIENAIKWQKFKTLKREVKVTREEVKSLDEEIKKLEAEEAPIAESLKSYEMKVAKLRRDTETADKEYSAITNKVEEFDITDLEESLDTLAEQEIEYEASETERLETKRRISSEIQELKAQIQDTKIDPMIDGRINELIQKRSNCEEQLSNTEQQKSETEFQKTGAKKEMNKLTRSWDNLQNASNRKLVTLQRENKDAYDGVLWLRNNMQLFSKKVHEPIMLCLDVKKPEYAKLVEIQIGKADLEGFVCESPEDVNLLTKKLREELSLRKINAFHSDPDPYSKFPHKHGGRNELEKYEFVEYLSDMYDAPDAVQAYLCRHKYLHEIPYFDKENKCSDGLKNTFKIYYVGNHKYNSTRSKYSGELSTGCEDISSRRVIRLASTVDGDHEEKVMAQLEMSKKTLAQHERRHDGLVKDGERINLDLAKMQMDLAKLRAEKNILSKLKSDLSMKEKTLAICKESTFDLNKEKKKIAQQKRENAFQLRDKMETLRDYVRATIDKEVRRKVLHVSYQNIESENSENLDKKEKYKKDLTAKKAEHKQVQMKFKQQEIGLRLCLSEAGKATGVLNKNKTPEIWSKRFELLGTSDVNVFRALLDDCETELKHTQPIPDKTIDDIKRNREKLDAAIAEMKMLDTQVMEKVQEANRLKRKWINGVEVLIQKIDDRFGKMMAELGYAGQIQLDQGKRDIDFSSYGISIKVRFRDGQELQELSRGVQSGGEKSVTTAVYMMALQELTQVPFRCVDEINQGMDERNERLVWDQLLNVCKKYKAQYFYMAPKFPYSLPFDDQVTIVVCNNGAVDKASRKRYRTESFVESAKRARTI